MHKQIKKVHVDGKEAELTIEIKDGVIKSSMRFFIEGQEQVIFKSTARKKTSELKPLSGPNVSEYLNMWKYHSQEHQEIVATVRLNDDLLRMEVDNKQEESVKTTYCQRFYNNGAHAGNIHYSIDAWGMNSPIVEAAIKQYLDEFISRLQVDWQGS